MTLPVLLTFKVPASRSTSTNCDGPLISSVPAPDLPSDSKPSMLPSGTRLPVPTSTSSRSMAAAAVDRAGDHRAVVHDEGVVAVAEREHAAAGIEGAGHIEHVSAVAQVAGREQRGARAHVHRVDAGAAGDRGAVAAGGLQRAVDIQRRVVGHRHASAWSVCPPQSAMPPFSVVPPT